MNEVLSGIDPGRSGYYSRQTSWHYTVWAVLADCLTYYRELKVRVQIVEKCT